MGGKTQRLPQWTDEMKACYISSRASGEYRNDSRRLVMETFPDAYDYSKYSLRDWEQSQLYREAYEEALKDVREKALQHSFSHMGSRVAALNETAEKTITAMRKIDSPEKSTPDWQRLSGVLVSAFKEIREEIGPEMTDAKSSPFQKFFLNLSKDPKGAQIMAMVQKAMEEEGSVNEPN